MPKSQRLDMVAHLLRTHTIPTQKELAKLLRRHNVPSTQATISRDLATLGAIKGRDGYSLPDEAPNRFVDAEALRATVRRHVSSVTPADSLVVIRTSPGHAGLLGVAIDRRPPAGVLGTIAGDDTLFLATNSRYRASKVTASLLAMLSDSEKSS